MRTNHSNFFREGIWQVEREGDEKVEVLKRNNQTVAFVLELCINEALISSQT
jgi:hypothetical protein